VRGYLPGERFSSITAFACQQVCCGHLYNIIHGYFEVSDGRISPIPGRIRVPCPMDDSPMCLTEIRGATRGYRCCRRDCAGRATV